MCIRARDVGVDGAPSVGAQPPPFTLGTTMRGMGVARVDTITSVAILCRVARLAANAISDYITVSIWTALALVLLLHAGSMVGTCVGRSANMAEEGQRRRRRRQR